MSKKQSSQKSASRLQRLFRTCLEENNSFPCKKNICNVQHGCSAFTCDESDPQGQWTPWIILPVKSSPPHPPQTTATQTALLRQGHKQCGAFIFPPPGSSSGFSIRERVRQKYCWGRSLQQNKLATAHKSSNYCPRLLLQKQFITQVFLLITMWMQFPW